MTTTKTRQDSWTPVNDSVLAETVLKHIRVGSTQLRAFDEAAEILQRTSAACGFRWNVEVRKRYESEIKQAKIARQGLKAGKSGVRARATSTKQPNTEILVTVSQVKEPVNEPSEINISDYLDQIINLAQNQKLQLANITRQIKSLSEQLSQKEREVERLKRELDEAKAQPSELTLNEDYRTLLEILQRARQLGAIGEGEKEKPAFRVDANGNIELIG